MIGELIRVYGPRGWEIRHDAPGVWTAERRRGTEIRFLAAVSAVALAVKIGRAEREEKPS